MSPLTDDNLLEIERSVLEDRRDCASRQEISAMVAEIRRHRSAAGSPHDGDLSDEEMVAMEDSVLVSDSPLGSAVIAATAEIRRWRRRAERGC